MNSLLSSKLKRKLQRELLKRLLTKYFIDKGYEESFDTAVYPPILADITLRIPELFNRIEVIPYIDELDTITNLVKIGWNLFVLGTNRIHLGVTSHTSMSELRMSISGAFVKDMPAEREVSPKEIVNFILKILDNSARGYVDLPKNFRLPPGVEALQLVGAHNYANFFGRPVSGTFMGK